MGYDMYLVQPEMPVVQRVEDQPDPNYFRLNISGMASQPVPVEIAKWQLAPKKISIKSLRFPLKV